MSIMTHNPPETGTLGSDTATTPSDDEIIAAICADVAAGNPVPGRDPVKRAWMIGSARAGRILTAVREATWSPSPVVEADPAPVDVESPPVEPEPASASAFDRTEIKNVGEVSPVMPTPPDVQPTPSDVQPTPPDVQPIIEAGRWASPGEPVIEAPAVRADTPALADVQPNPPDVQPTVVDDAQAARPVQPTVVEAPAVRADTPALADVQPTVVAASDPVDDASPAHRAVAIWPVLVLVLPAAVAIWGGWVDLGRMCGYGPIVLLPGIADEWTVDTSITLPIGMEAYAAYALYVWLSGRTSPRTNKFAKWSAIASLLLGMAGQAAYHLMVSMGMEAAPPIIVLIVACLPVAVLGMGAALAHMAVEDRH